MSDLTQSSVCLVEVKIVEREGTQHLAHVFKPKNFVQALAFTNKVGELAKAEAHHPAILTEWGRVTVTWWTHKIRGLHRNDFIMAAGRAKGQETFARVRNPCDLIAATHPIVLVPLARSNPV